MEYLKILQTYAFAPPLSLSLSRVVVDKLCVLTTVYPESFAGENFRKFRGVAAFRESFIYLWFYRIALKFRGT